MKHIITLSVILFLAACTKEEQKCKTCTLIVESNEKEAEYKCDGLANNYPVGYEIISSANFGMYCDDELTKAISSNYSEQKIDVCNGVKATIRKSLDCK